MRMVHDFRIQVAEFNSIQFSSIYLQLEIGVTPLLTPQKPTEVQRIIVAGKHPLDGSKFASSVDAWFRV